MPDQVSNRVCLTGSRRTLHQRRTVPRQLLRNSDLFRIGGLAEQHILGLTVVNPTRWDGPFRSRGGLGLDARHSQ